jgi:hypothetical protein
MRTGFDIWKQQNFSYKKPKRTVTVDIRGSEIGEERTASSKALRLDCIWQVLGTARRPVWLQQNGQREDRRAQRWAEAKYISFFEIR